MSGYLHFTKTGAPGVDHLLNMLTMAGNSFHHTAYWQEPGIGDEPSLLEIVQAAADIAGENERKHQAEVERLRGQVTNVYDECMKVVAEECEEFGDTVVRAAYHAVKTLKRKALAEGGA